MSRGVQQLGLATDDGHQSPRRSGGASTRVTPSAGSGCRLQRGDFGRALGAAAEMLVEGRELLLGERTEHVRGCVLRAPLTSW